MSNNSWEKIFSDYEILNHNFDESPFPLTAQQIKVSCQNFKRTTEKEVRILCKHDSRENLPKIMADNGLFLLPVKNGEYVIVKGQGFFDIPNISGEPIDYPASKLAFIPTTSFVGNSEMQHVDYAYAISIIRTFLDDDSLVLTVRGRKYTPQFSFRVGKQTITTKSVQTEVDAGYEGKYKFVIVEAKNSETTNTIIRQLFYPYRQWSAHLNTEHKEVVLVFFEKRESDYLLWRYKFKDKNDYNSIELVSSAKYRVV